MRGRKYIIVSILSWATITLFLWVFVSEGRRMEVYDAQRVAGLVARGTEIYAQNCVVCHGPRGEGVIGPALNRASYQGDPEDNRETYDLIYDTIARGRPGTTTPKWHPLPNGAWASYTAMPTWSVEEGGPLNEQHIASLAYFIMLGDWGEVGSHIPRETVEVDEDTGAIDVAATVEKMPAGDPALVSAAVSVRGRELFVEKTCIVCHSVGSVGGNIGPDLSQVGAWAPDLARSEWADFLRSWISNPQAVENRAPVYWSNYSGPLQFPTDADTGPELGAESQTSGQGSAPGDRIGQEGLTGGSVGPDFELPLQTELGPTQMPRIPMTDEELDTLVAYLTSLI